MLTKIKNALRQPENRRIIAIVILLFIIINVIAWLSLRPYMKQPPCYVCGRAKTRPVKTLYQYRVEVLPYMKSVDIWYCERHYQHAAEIVTKLPIKNDSVASRFRIAVIAGTFSLFSLLFIIILLEMSFNWLFIHSGLIALTYLVGGVTSNLTVVILLISTFALAIGIFYFWNRWFNK
jgi:hypothetical protein